ncbi:DUF2569 domain-containing protein [Paenibacillus sp. SYP-B3998]|uniref:DUF2569 domain-containing protein n=1 Tax=Paenibacillus sp. SYP-B3998 TaxID=2678564 RepID=A0A6G4A352_9BACL|nr:DUF2569 family protein [Paenibacillus sp. SYP-B3998]NEW08364.1 DUF2569 domain-containing protein [Paenibacillus sp. SYP-B3998]
MARRGLNQQWKESLICEECIVITKFQDLSLIQREIELGVSLLSDAEIIEEFNNWIPSQTCEAAAQGYFSFMSSIAYFRPTIIQPLLVKALEPLYFLGISDVEGIMRWVSHYKDNMKAMYIPSKNGLLWLSVEFPNLEYEVSLLLKELGSEDTIIESGNKVKEDRGVVCPWCESKLESGISHCPKCDNEIVEFDLSIEDSVDSLPIRGWLLIYSATCIIAIFFICYSYLLIIKVGISNVEWTNQLLLLTSYNVLHLICLIASLILIMSKKKHVPKVIVGLEVLNLIAFGVNFFLSYKVAAQSSLMTGVSIKVLWIGLWICYFLMSKRVKQTFVH